MLTTFIEAIEHGDLATMSRFPEHVNARYENTTPLHLAALSGHIDAARWLLDHGAELESRDKEFHSTPVVWANERGHVAMVEFLLERGASLDEWSAASTGNLERLEQLVARNPEILEEEHDFGTLLHQACIWGQVPIVDWLIARGANVRLRSRHGFTPLELAERQSRDARSHSPLVTDERRALLERDCAAVARCLRDVLATMPSQGELVS